MFDDPSKAYLKQQLERRTANLPERVKALLNSREPHEALAWLDENDDGRSFIEAPPDPNAVIVTDADRAVAATAQRAGYSGITPESVAARRKGK